MALKPPPRVPRFIISLSLLSGLTFVMYGAPLVDQLGLGVWGLLGLAAPGVLLPLLVASTFRRPEAPVIELAPDRLWLPRTANIADQLAFTYRDVTGLFLRPGRFGFVWIGTEAAVFMYPIDRFNSPGDAQRLVEALESHIADALPDGEERVRSFALHASAAVTAYRRPVLATIGLVSLIVVGTVATTTLRTLDVFNLVYAGAFVHALILEHGQWWRIGASVWMSLPVEGLIAGTTVAVFGMMVERLFGGVHVLTVAAASVVLGTAMTLFTGDWVGLGATPMAVGMFTAMAFTAQSKPALLPVGFRPPGLWWILTGSLLVSLTGLLSDQALSMHIGGALAGVLVTAPRLDAALPLRGPSPAPLRAVAVLFVVLTAGCLGLAAQNASVKSRLETDQLLAAARERGWGNHPMWNEMGWRLAVAPEVIPEQLAQAAVLVERAVGRTDDLDPETGAFTRRMYEDTLATIRYRQGRLDEAVELQQGVVRTNEGAVYATQLARFLDRRLQDGAYQPPPDFPNVSLQHDPQGFGVVIDRAATSTVTVWGVVRSSSGLTGLLRFVLTPRSPVQTPITLRDNGTQAEWPSDARLMTADTDEGSADWTAWTADPEILELP